MRFITIMGLTLIARAINEDVFLEHSTFTFFGILSVLAIAMDSIEFYKRNIKK